MSDFGGVLKQAREERGISLRQIATATKISVVALEALERDDFSRLPGGIFSRAFVRAYALEVGLDPEKTVDDFLVECEKRGNEIAENALPEVTPDDRAFLERQRRAARWLRGISLAVVLGIVAAIVAWRVASRPKTDAAEAAVANDAAPPPAAAPSPVVTAPPPAPKTPAATAVQTPAPAPAPINSALPSAPPAAPPKAAAAPGADQVALHLEAASDCWVRVTVDDTVVTERTLKAGEIRDFRPGRLVLLQVGDAGALRWTINGQAAKALGRSGETASAHISRSTMGSYVQ